MSITLPEAFARFKRDDTNFELVSSNLIQPVRLTYRRNFVTKSNAIIFVSTECKGVAYPDAIQRSEIASNLFSEVFEFQEHKVYTNFSKQQILEKLNELKQQVEHFEQNKQEGETFAAAIVWIGFVFRPEMYD